MFDGTRVLKKISTLLNKFDPMLFSKYFLKLCYLAKIMITHDGTPSLRPSAYKSKMGGVSS